MNIAFTVPVILSCLFAMDVDMIDLVSIDGELYVACNENVQIWGTTTERSFGSICNPSLGVATLNGTEVLLYSRCHTDEPDSLYILNPLTLETIAHREILPEHFAEIYNPDNASMTVRLSRYQPEDDIFYLSANPACILGSDVFRTVVSAKLTYSESDGIQIIETFVKGGFGMPVYDYSGLTAPVFSGSASTPMVFWSIIFGEYGPYITKEYCGIHMPYRDQRSKDYQPMLTGVIYMAEGTVGEIKCSGASDSEAVVIWRTETQELLYSVFDCTGTQVLLQEPMLSPPYYYTQPVLSCNPNDEGMLLVWEEQGEISCRYRGTEWNSWHYVVSEIDESKFHGDLKVCSTSEGYWICRYMGQGIEPELYFVSRDDLLSIAESEEDTESSLSISPNPCNSSVTIFSNRSIADTQVSIYDLSGRLAGTVHLDESSSGSFNTGDLNPGTYLVTSENGSSFAALKLVVIR